MNDILTNLSQLITSNYYFAPILSLIAGLLTSFMPCNLSSIPLIISVTSASANTNTKKAFKLSLIFSLGLSITFTILAIITSLSASLFGSSSSLLYFIVGIVMILMAFQTWELFEIIPSTYLASKNKFKGYFGALISGVLSGIFSSPCSTPVLIALLSLVATLNNIYYSIILLLCYSIGHSIITIIAGTSITFINKIIQNKKYGVFSTTIKIILGILMTIIGIYLIYISI